MLTFVHPSSTQNLKTLKIRVRHRSLNSRRSPQMCVKSAPNPFKTPSLILDNHTASLGYTTPLSDTFIVLFQKMSGSDNGSPGGGKPEDPRATEHLNIKVTDNNNEVFFKIKRTTQLKKLMDAFCERQGKAPTSVRFLFEGTRVGPTDSPETVCSVFSLKAYSSCSTLV